MTSTNEIVACYEEIAEISTRMLAEAEQNHWDAVFTLGEAYCCAVEGLRTLDLRSPENREARRELLSRILNNDADIRRLAMPELERLSGLLGNVKRQHRVLRTYSGTISGSIA